MYQNFISLGWFCGTAASLSKYGFRNCSGPFDWYYSEDLKSVLHIIETGFIDFMKKENLKIDINNRLIFQDVKYDMIFNHEIQSDFEKEYEDIYKKYKRRIERFKVQIQEPTCFLRAVKDKEEIQFVLNHEEYINDIIKRSNTSNQILFLIPRWISKFSGGGNTVTAFLSEY